MSTSTSSSRSRGRLRSLRAALLAAALASTALLATGPSGARAATSFDVASNQDFGKLAASGALCKSDQIPGNPCTLRAAIETANLAAPGAAINVPTSLGTITLDPLLGPLTATASMTITAVGAGSAIVDGASSAISILVVNGLGPVSVTVTGFTFQHGTNGVVNLNTMVLNNVVATQNSSSGLVTLGTMTVNGGTAGQNLSTGVVNLGTLTLDNVTVTGNHAANGAGVVDLGPLTMIGGSVSGNIATTDGGGLYVVGGATAAVTGTSFTGNQANFGGGILELGTATLDGVSVSGNHAATGAGGIFVFGSTESATVENSTISGNDSPGGLGGGIDVTSGNLTLTTSTVSGNSVSTLGLGGGLYAVISAVLLQNDTFSGNSARSGGGILQEAVGPVSTTSGAAVRSSAKAVTDKASAFARSLGRGMSSGGAQKLPGGRPPRAPLNDMTLESVTVAGNSAAVGGGVLNGAGATLRAHDSIVATNTATTTGPDCSGSIVSGGYNLESGAGCSFTGGGDQMSTNPLLGALGGTPLQTMTPQAGSPAIDRGDPRNCPPPSVDELGTARPQGPRCDIGAVEVIGGAPVSAVPAPPATGRWSSRSGFDPGPAG